MPQTSDPARRTRMSLGCLGVVRHGTAGHLQNIAYRCFSPCLLFLVPEDRQEGRQGGSAPVCRQEVTLQKDRLLQQLCFPAQAGPFPAALLLPVLSPHLACMWSEEDDTSLQSTRLQVPLVLAYPGTLWNRINLSISLSNKVKAASPTGTVLTGE